MHSGRTERCQPSMDVKNKQNQHRPRGRRSQSQFCFSCRGFRGSFDAHAVWFFYRDTEIVSDKRINWTLSVILSSVGRSLLRFKVTETNVLRWNDGMMSSDRSPRANQLLLEAFWISNVIPGEGGKRHFHVFNLNLGWDGLKRWETSAAASAQNHV